MKLDKELYRQAYELHKQYNEAELRERIRNPEQRPPKKLWQHYVGLWEFCMNFAPPPSEHQSKQRMADWNHYYTRIQKLEEWRQRVGKTT